MTPARSDKHPRTMNKVTLTIGGRDYIVACDAGEEAHLAKLGRMIEGKLDPQAGHSPHGEARGLLFAALLLADELCELRESATPRGDDEPGGLSRAALEALAERLEALADEFERHPPAQAF